MADGQRDETSKKRALTDGSTGSRPLGARPTADVGRAVGGTLTLDSIVGLDIGSPRTASGRSVIGAAEYSVVASDYSVALRPTAVTTGRSSR